ncbi:MAG: tRNA lysidine(34) synthetase TilS [Synechococcus sp.]|nr:tRNA lysidine(34) synthetase TilS [Synechococcus sp.]
MIWSPLHARLHSHLKATELLPQRTKILMAISGGQDSLCLGRLLLDLCVHWEWSLAIAHCHHGWSGDDLIASQVECLAEQWQLPFYLCRATPQLPETENAARQWRYRTLTDLAQEYRIPFIVTGHTQSDRAETLIYNLVRGTGTVGLGSLTAQRPLDAKVTLVRPLLNMTRQETGDFCQKFQLPVSLDPYNQQLRFKRNQIRQQTLPHLRQLNRQADKHLAQTALILQAENDYLEAIAQQHLEQALSSDNHLQRFPLQSLHIALQRRIIRQFLQRILPQMPTFSHIIAVTQLISGANRDCVSTLPGSIQLRVEGEWIISESTASAKPCPSENN